MSGRGRGQGDRGRGSGDRGRGSGDRGRGRGGGSGGGGDRGGIAFRGGPPSRGGDRGRGGGQGGGQRGKYGPPPGPIIFLEGQGVETRPDQKITALEDKQVQLIKDRTIDGFSTRPGYGTAGKAINVRVNCFQLSLHEVAKKLDVPLHKYNVDTGREQLTKPKRRQLITAILARREFSGVQWATDYSTVIVTTDKLKGNFSGNVEIRDPHDEVSQSSSSGQGAQIAQGHRTREFTVSYEATFLPRHLLDYLNRTEHGQEYQGRVDVLQLLNIIINKACTDDACISISGQNSFFPIRTHPCVDIRDLGSGLTAHRGFFSSVRCSIGRILVNVNVSHGAFFNEWPLRRTIHAICGGVSPKASQKGLLTKVEPIIHHLKVATKYMRPRDSKGNLLPNTQPMVRVKTLQQFSKTRGPNWRYLSCKETIFRYVASAGAQEQQVSVEEYFRHHHNITLEHPDEPPIDVGALESTNWIPLELCERILPGQPYRDFLQGTQTTEMIRFAATPPATKARAIEGNNSDGPGLQTLRLRGPDQAQSINPFGLSVEPRMITVPARILNPPRLEYGQRMTVDPRPGSGSWNLQKGNNHVKFFKPGRFTAWMTATIDDGGSRIFQQQPVGLMNNFGAELASYGIQTGPRKEDVRFEVPPATYRDSQDQSKRRQYRQATETKIKEMFERAVGHGAQIILVVIKDHNQWLYSRIKFFGDCTFGVHTVICIGHKFIKADGEGMLGGNLALKFNIKGGGVNHKIAQDQLQPFNASTIVFGIDVTHPSPGSVDGAPSIAGVVANKDEFLCQFPASIRIQERRKEIVTELKEMVLERFALWRKFNKGLPDKVIVYRDGVSEGQYNDVLAYEKAAFVEAFNEQYGGQPKHPKLFICIVGKRHHIRAYATNAADADNKGNLLAGTIIDRGITHPTRHDYYLQAHGVLQGTGRSAHYDTLQDEIKFSADTLQRFTHNFSYLFARATKAVSVVPPAYYADLVCERARQYLHSTLQEGKTSETKAFKREDAEWTRGVHEKLAESTFYV